MVVYISSSLLFMYPLLFGYFLFHAVVALTSFPLHLPNLKKKKKKVLLTFKFDFSLVISLPWRIRYTFPPSFMVIENWSKLIQHSER